MNILFIIRYFYPFIGGTEKQALALASFLVKKGVNVKIITSRFEGQWPRCEIIDNVEVVRLLSPRIKIWGALTFLLCLAVYLIKNRKHFSLIHTFQIGYTSFVGIFLSILLRKPSIIKLSSSGWGGDVQRARKTPFGKIFLFMAKKASRVITLSTTIEQELIEEKMDPSKICLVHNGVDLTRLKQIEGKSQLRKELGIVDKKTIIYTGRLSPEKGVDFLIRSFSQLNGGTDCQLIIVADGPGRENIIRLLDQYQLSKSVILIPEVDEVARYLNAADLFVLPSRFEGLSNSLLEAMACGLPVISTRVGGSIDIIEDGINGLFVDIDNEEQLTRAMSKVFNDSLLAITLGGNARKTIEASYDLNKIADKYLELYKELGST
jgi:glycosyltransferase involved in cell wall biosynthesis